MITKQKAKEILDSLIRDSIERVKKTIHDQVPSWENFDLWRQASMDCLEQIYGANHRNVVEFSQIRFANPANLDSVAQLVSFIVGLTSAKERLLASLISIESYWDENIKTITYPTVFLSCSEKSKQIAKDLKQFLTSLGAKVIFVSEEPNLNLSVEDKVMHYMAQCDLGIAVLTGDDKLESGQKINKRNIDHEIGLMSESKNFNNRIIIIKEEGLQKSSNYAEKVHIGFSRRRFGDDVYPSLVKELRAFGYF